jgi:hypothetical protein
LSVLVAITAIKQRFTAVGIGAASLRVLFEGHHATLAEFIGFFHNDVFLIV